MSETHWSTCQRCNTKTHTTHDHDHGIPDSLRIQPPPSPHARQAVLPLVMADYEARMQYYASPQEYGVPLSVDNLRDHLRDAYAEALDLPGYLKAALVFWDQMLDAMVRIRDLAATATTHNYTHQLRQIQQLAEPYRVTTRPDAIPVPATEPGALPPETRLPVTPAE